MRARYADLARRGARTWPSIPSSPDALNFTTDRQPLVDAAFLAHALLRAPRALRDGLDAAARANARARARVDARHRSGLQQLAAVHGHGRGRALRLGARWDRVRVDYALRQHAQWYKGDGAYGDGPDFHWDYYNSFVIQPMLLDVLAALGERLGRLEGDAEPRSGGRSATRPSRSG